MKRKALTLLLAGMMLVSTLAGCVADDGPDVTPPPVVNNDPGTIATPPPPEEEIADEAVTELEYVDGNWRFIGEPRKITVEIFERNNDIRTPAHDNFYTDWIKAEVLRLHNVEVTEYVSVGRWEEADTIPLWLASGDAPDVCVTYNFTAIQEYAAMGAVHDLSPLVHNHRSRLPHLWDLFTESNIYGALNPETGAIYWIETTLANRARINTFAREDWLNLLGLSEPKTIQEYEDMLIAFRDNADLLLGADAARMVPLVLSHDVAWQMNNLFSAYAPTDITDRQQYIYGGDDRQILWPGNKEAVRMLNRWYNEGLIYEDFALITQSSTTHVDMMKAGYVGSFGMNWDFAYRDGDNWIHNVLRQEAGQDAAFIAIDPFANVDGSGDTFKVMGSGFDRKIFFPMTNTEPLASMFYVDFMSRPETIQFLQLGVEGINYDLVDGIPISKPVVGTLKDEEGNDVLDENDKPIVTDDTNLQYIINSSNNIDMTITINGFYPHGITGQALSNSFQGTEPRYITRALEIAYKDAIPGQNLNLGEILSASGMTNALRDKRDTMLANAIRASVADFDAVYDAGWKEMMDSGAQAILNERTERWITYYGDADFPVE